MIFLKNGDWIFGISDEGLIPLGAPGGGKGVDMVKFAWISWKYMVCGAQKCNNPQIDFSVPKVGSTPLILIHIQMLGVVSLLPL